MIPILDLKAQYEALAPELDAAMRSVAASGHYILGPNVKALEEAIAEYCECKIGVGVANGTDALHLALRALRIGPGDEVITTPFTFVATTEAIGMVGAKPVFVDIDSTTFNMDPARLESAITPRTRAILPVHLYGHPCDMGPILETARRRGLKVIEDCAQAIGATYHGKKVGSLGDVGCLSFFPSKNLGCFGDGGMVVTNDKELAGRVEMLRRHGGRIKYQHEELGLNSRLDELQAAILRVKLTHLERWIERRREVAHRYDELLRTVAGIVPPVEKPGSRCSYHQYTIRTKERDLVQERLRFAGVQTMVYYPIPLHLQEVHADLRHLIGDFPVAEQAAATALSLPMFPELEDKKVVAAAEALRNAVQPTGAGGSA